MSPLILQSSRDGVRTRMEGGREAVDTGGRPELGRRRKNNKCPRDTHLRNSSLGTHRRRGNGDNVSHTLALEPQLPFLAAY